MIVFTALYAGTNLIIGSVEVCEQGSVISCYIPSVIFDQWQQPQMFLFEHAQ
jgi:hypothetical protein